MGPDSRIKFKVQYRQVFEGSSEVFTLINDELILVYATEQPPAESFLIDFTTPKIYKGYDISIILHHSDGNNDDDALVVLYDELDINKQDLTTNNAIETFTDVDYGFLNSFFEGTTTLNANTRFIKFKTLFTALSDYSPADYDNAEYLTT